MNGSKGTPNSRYTIQLLHIITITEPAPTVQRGLNYMAGERKLLIYSFQQTVQICPDSSSFFSPFYEILNLRLFFFLPFLLSNSSQVSICTYTYHIPRVICKTTFKTKRTSQNLARSNCAVLYLHLPLCLTCVLRRFVEKRQIFYLRGH